MKIAITNNLYRPFNRGGAETITEIIKQELENEGNQIKIISTKPHNSAVNNKNIYYLNSIFYNINKIPYPFRMFWHIWDTFNFINYFKIKKILQKEKFDLVISNNLKGIGLLAPLAIKKLKIRHIHILHDIQLIHPSGLMIFGQEKKIDNLSSKIYQKISAQLFKNVDKIVSPSKWLLDMHTNRQIFKNSKKDIIENPITYNKSEIKEYKANKENFNFLYVGQIEDHKGIFFLNKVFRENNLNLKIIGDGGDKKNKLKLNKNIQYLGKKTKEEVKMEMQKADCLIVPSLCYENSPTVIFEALGVNTMVLASDIGGIPDIISKTKNNFLFQANNPKDLNDKIQKILQIQCNVDNSKYFKTLSSSRYIKKILL